MLSIVRLLRVGALCLLVLLAAACGAAPAAQQTGANATAAPAAPETGAYPAAGPTAPESGANPAAGSSGKKVNVVTPYMANATTKFAI